MDDEFELDGVGTGLSLAADPFQILCLSGGGYRGLYSATVLEALEEKAGRPLGQTFDLIAGTSIGGILAIGLAAGVPASKLRQAFEDHGDAIFPTHYKLRGRKVIPRLGFGLFRRKHSPLGLSSTIKAILANAGSSATIADLRTPVLITSVNVTNQEAAFFSQTVNGRTPLLDAALATSAAPGYFPEHKIGKTVHVDGGLVANAPDILALAHALGAGHDLGDIQILSVGTVDANTAQVPRSPSGVGVLPRAKQLFSLTLAAQQRMAVNQATALLGNHHLRLDARASPEQFAVIGLDRVGARAKDTLKLLAEETVARAETSHPARLRQLLGHTSRAHRS